MVSWRRRGEIGSKNKKGELRRKVDNDKIHYEKIEEILFVDNFGSCFFIKNVKKQNASKRERSIST